MALLAQLKSKDSRANLKKAEEGSLKDTAKPVSRKAAAMPSLAGHLEAALMDKFKHAQSAADRE